MSRRAESLPTSPATSEPGASNSNRRPLAAALLAVFIGALDLTVIATILPPMIFDLDVNTADVDRYIWVVNGYLIAYIVAIPIMGRVSDLVGRRLAFVAALGVFVVGSLWCAFATGLGPLIVGRTIQGVGGGALLPVTMALVGDLLPPARRTAALGLVGAVDTLGWVLGPLWGAAIFGLFGGQHEPWRLVFWINVPLALIAAAAIAVTGKRVTRRELRPSLHRLDVVGTVLLAITTLFLNLGLASGGEIGGATPGSGMRVLGGTKNPLAAYLVPLLIGAAVVGAVFVWWERRASMPVLPLSLLRVRAFSAAILANFAVGVALIVAMVDVPLVVALLVTQDRVSAVSALMLAPFTVLMAALSLAGGVVAGRIGQRATAAVGLVLVGIGYVALYFGLHGEHYPGMIPGLIVAGAGFGLVIAPVGATVINVVPALDRGIAAGLTIVFRLLGMTIGISALTAFGVRRLQTLIDRLPLPTQPPNATAYEIIQAQQKFIAEHVIPTSVLVIRETFLIAAAIAIVALVPVMLMGPGTHAPATVDALDGPEDLMSMTSSRPSRDRSRREAPPAARRSPRSRTASR